MNMKLTKLVHSCLLIESNHGRTLVDPGNYSWQSGVVLPEHLQNINNVAITHVHPDHCDENFVKAILANSPNAVWFGPTDVQLTLSTWGINNFATEALGIKPVDSKHTHLAPWFPNDPDHTSYLIDDTILISGDCHSISDGLDAPIFAAAVNGGPWGSVLDFVRMIETMKNRPKQVVPLHDWHWNTDARKAIYARLVEVLPQFGVSFTALEDGVATSIDLS